MGHPFFEIFLTERRPVQRHKSLSSQGVPQEGSSGSNDPLKEDERLQR
jgi:hypothetical protein